MLNCANHITTHWFSGRHHSMYSLKVSPLYCALFSWLYAFCLGWVWPNIGTALIVIERAVALLAPIWYWNNWNQKMENQLVSWVGFVVIAWTMPAPLLAMYKHFIAVQLFALQCSVTISTSLHFPLAQISFSTLMGLAASILLVYSFIVGKKRLKGNITQSSDNEESRRH